MSYLDDILFQPAAMRRLIDVADETIAAIRLPMPLGDYDRIIVTGMGGSHFANYYLCRELTARGFSVEWTPTDELISLGALPTNQRIVVIAASQSGLSGEVVAWVQQNAGARNIDLISITNNPDARVLLDASHASILLRAGEEATVSTKTYLNTLAAARLLVHALTGTETTTTLAGLRDTADGIEEYLAGPWRDALTGLVEADRQARARLLVGRAGALGTVLQGALITKEAAKLPYEGLSAGQFRHGPLDLADERLLVWFFADGDYMSAENDGLIDDLVRFGAKVFTTGMAGAKRAGAQTIPMPRVPVGYDEFARIIPVELANIPLSEAEGHEPGTFRHNDKVTTKL